VIDFSLMGDKEVLRYLADQAEISAGGWQETNCSVILFRLLSICHQW
jgi:hypothetical protein